jgi:hypothetical protein
VVSRGGGMCECICAYSCAEHLANVRGSLQAERQAKLVLRSALALVEEP